MEYARSRLARRLEPERERRKGTRGHAGLERAEKNMDWVCARWLACGCNWQGEMGGGSDG
jgi:hypothetical protein